MAKVQTGDQKAFKLLFDKYKGPIMGYVTTLIGDKILAEEICQEVFLRVYRFRDSYTPKARFTTWLWTIARNASIDYLRGTDKNETIHETEENSLIDKLDSDLPNAEAQLIQNSEVEKINKCLDKLPVSQKDLLLLQINSDLSYEQMSEMTGNTVSAVKSLLFRARNALLNCLKGGCDE